MRATVRPCIGQLLKLRIFVKRKKSQRNRGYQSQFQPWYCDDDQDDDDDDDMDDNVLHVQEHGDIKLLEIDTSNEQSLLS